MKVLLLAADQGGCAKYRVREPHRVTKDLVDVEVSNALEVDAIQDTRTGLTTVREVKTDADLIVFQRPLDNAMSSALIQAKKQGIAVAVEMDDDLAATHPQNMAYGYFHGHLTTGIQWLWRATQNADFVIASTPALLDRYAPNGNGVVVRNCIPESIFDITPRYERTDETSMIGWTGSVASHPTDLLATKGAVAEAVTSRIKSGRQLAMSVVGELDRVYDHLQMPSSVPSYSPGWLSLDDYYEGIASSMDVGIVPLELNIFNKSKSFLKGLEMGALGIPFVASDTYEYKIFESYGIGQTAANPSDWRRKLGRLIDNRAKTVSLAKDYRDKIREEHTYEKNADQWLKAWESAIRARKSN